MASLTDDTKELKLLADGNLDKRNIWLIGVGHTRTLHYAAKSVRKRDD